MKTEQYADEQLVEPAVVVHWYPVGRTREYEHDGLMMKSLTIPSAEKMEGIELQPVMVIVCGAPPLLLSKVTLMGWVTEVGVFAEYVALKLVQDRELQDMPLLVPSH